MSSNERIRGVQIYRPIIYGSHARLLTPEEKLTAPEGHSHRWTVFLTSATSPPPATSSSSSSSDPYPPEVDMDYIAGGADDLSYLIKKVTFKLHESFPNPNRDAKRLVFDKPPFRVTETGWGEFPIPIRIQFVSESGEKPMQLSHLLRLHHWGPIIEAAPIPTSTSGEAGPSTSADPTPTPIPQATPAAGPSNLSRPTDGQESSSNMATEAKSAETSAVPTDTIKAESHTALIPASAAAPAPLIGPSASTETMDIEESASTPLESTIIVAQAPPTPISIAAKYPVYAWQYDELVFSDPTTAFYNLMNEHAPTPLPPKNRRARDQREQHDNKSGVGAGPKSKKGRMSGISGAGNRSREGTTVPATDLLLQDPNNRDKTTGLAAFQVGIPGEPGSADVPLEFSQEMEKAEYARLTEARVRIVEEMDKWRERLIAQEKELGALREEMRGGA